MGIRRTLLAFVVEFLLNMNESFFITFKYGGNLAEVKGHNRQKYIGGKQRTVKFMRDFMNLDMLKNEVEVICPWIRGHNFVLYYFDIKTTPKQYKVVANDADIVEMITNYDGRNEAEVVVVLQGNNDLICAENEDLGDQNQILELYNSNYGCGGDVDIMVDNVRETCLLCETGEVEMLKVGSRFKDAQHFKQALRTEAISQSVAIKIKASDRTRVIATCAYPGCLWRVRASLCPDGQTFEVRKIDAAHICPGVNRAGNKQATSTWVANEIQEIIKKNPDIPPKQLNNSLEATYGLSLPYMKLWRSRELARNMTFGTVDENYNWVPTLASELIKRNPGSHIIYTYESHDNSFKRFYCSFKVCKDGFLAGCRHLIGVDACHLKSKYLGVLLSANSLDGNNGLFTIAFAVVESESKSTWEWFLHNLVETLGFELDHLAFISDMEKGLGEAIKNVFPNAEHRVCMRHLWTIFWDDKASSFFC